MPQLARYQVDVASWHVDYGENRSICTKPQSSKSKPTNRLRIPILLGAIFSILNTPEIASSSLSRVCCWPQFAPASEHQLSSSNWNLEMALALEKMPQKSIGFRPEKNTGSFSTALIPIFNGWLALVLTRLLTATCGGQLFSDWLLGFLFGITRGQPSNRLTSTTSHGSCQRIARDHDILP